MNSKPTQSLPPSLSCNILERFIGKRVIKLIRYSWWRKEDIASECGISNEQAFSLTAGPLAVVFEDGSTLGVASDPSINSVIIWLDRVAGQENITSTLGDDNELFPIDSNDDTYSGLFWKQFSNRILVGVSIIKRKSMSPGERELPSELGLCFRFDGNKRFIAAHGLHDGTDDFSVLEGSQIKLATGEQLQEVALL